MDKLQWYIFDLDGTLYDFWGARFTSSKLWLQIQKRYYALIQEWNLWDPEEVYNSMIEIEHKEKIGTSQQLANLIGTSRWTILSIIWWSIEPTSVIENAHYAKEIIPTLSQKDKLLFLVTAAPKIWATKALEYMVLTEYFQQILALEDYGNSKKEAFQRIQSQTWLKASQFISIGDQKHSDIVPAEEIWMKTLLVSSPKDLLNLI